MYNFYSRVRYSETDGSEHMTLPAIVDYFQDAAIFQSEDVGYGTEVMRSINRAWMIASWQIEVKRYPRHTEKIIVSTFPYEFRGFMGSRNCEMRTESGEVLARGNCIWILMNLIDMKPARIDDEIKDSYEAGEKLPMNYKPRKIAIPSEGGEKLDPLTVGRHNLDSLYHVNNSQYIKIAADMRKRTGIIAEVRAEYKKQAHLGEVFYPEIYVLPDSEIICLRDEKDGVYAVVEFSERV